MTPTGARTVDNATHVAVVKQTGGEGLLATRPCAASSTPVLPEVPVASLLPIVAAAIAGTVFYRRRRTA